MPIKGIDHIDLAVTDVERSPAFYLGVFGALGVEEALRFDTYRGTEEVVYLRFGDQMLGLRQADGGEFRYYEVGLAVALGTRLDQVAAALSTYEARNRSSCDGVAAAGLERGPRRTGRARVSDAAR